MMQGFLKHYSKAIDLDNEDFKHLFPEGCQRADFLLFDEAVICEFKDLREFDIQSRVEHVARKKFTSEGNLKRDINNTINNALSKANKQIRETKKTLNKPDSIGLIIFENHIPKDITGAALLGAADDKMKNGLDNTDGVLCLDFVNVFAGHNMAQLALPVAATEETEKTKKLYSLVEILMNDFGVFKQTHINKGDISDIQQQWSVDCDGQYNDHNCRVRVIR